MPVAGSTCESPEAQTLTPHETHLKIPPASGACNMVRRRFLYCRYIVLGIKIVIFARENYTLDNYDTFDY